MCRNRILKGANVTGLQITYSQALGLSITDLQIQRKPCLDSLMFKNSWIYTSKIKSEIHKVTDGQLFCFTKRLIWYCIMHFILYLYSR